MAGHYLFSRFGDNKCQASFPLPITTMRGKESLNYSEISAIQMQLHYMGNGKGGGDGGGTGKFQITTTNSKSAKGGTLSITTVSPPRAHFSMGRAFPPEYNCLRFGFVFKAFDRARLQVFSRPPPHLLMRDSSPSPYNL